ncbi:MAG: oligosaccharide flippase family protein [Myxococcales bacterium]|jgi:O-antigen/teichoic acid export membrane protein|nr:oligosaccharide flippase family protein [Myxococcales bacterium]
MPPDNSPDQAPQNPPARATEDHGRTIAKGAVVNGLGLLGKALIPVFFIVGARIYGTAVMGLFYLSYTMIIVAESLVSSGFNSGTIMFVSRAMARSDRDEAMYRVLANSFVLSLGITFLLIFLSHVGGAQFVLRRYPQEGLLLVVQWMVLALPFLVTSTVTVAATKGHLTMKWDALLFGFARPFSLTLFAVLFYFLVGGIWGIVLAYLLTEVLICAFALVLFGRYFSWRHLLRALVRFRLDSPLIRFAIPQSLNTTFNTFITNVDVIMLGYFGLAEPLIFAYGMGAQIVRNVRQVKLVLSEPLGPVVARLHGHHDPAAISEYFSMVARWITTVGYPIALAVALLRLDLLHLFDAAYDDSTAFMLLLLVPPLLSVSFGLAGNILVMTGHSMWNLLNSTTVAAVNVVLNYLLIPRLGLLGAALATVIASATMSLMQLIEVRKLLGVAPIPSQIYKPYVAIAAPVLMVIAVESGLFGVGATLLGRILAAVVGILLFFGILWAQKIEPRDMEILFPFLKKRRSTDAPQ